MTAIVLLLVACTGARVSLGSHDGGTDAAPVRHACGPITCPDDLVCCNPSCGLCAAPGDDCPSTGADECGDAGLEPDGGCVSCEARAGCRLVGQTCDSCGVQVCTCGDAPCASGELCDYPESCGTSGAAGVCIPMPTRCDDACSEVCGCDGTTFCSECVAHARGVDVAYPGPCGLPDACAAFDADSEGGCATDLGFTWNGRACAPLVGCRCLGADCTHLYRTPEECVTAHAACMRAPCGEDITCPPGFYCDYDGLCPRPALTGYCSPRPTDCPSVVDQVCGCDGVTYQNECLARRAGVAVETEGACGDLVCAPMDARVIDTSCDLVLGVAWDGMRCAPLVGCACVGSDCGTLYSSVTLCTRRRSACAMMPVAR